MHEADCGLEPPPHQKSRHLGRRIAIRPQQEAQYLLGRCVYSMVGNLVVSSLDAVRYAWSA
jgi:hypothetical protein